VNRKNMKLIKHIIFGSTLIVFILMTTSDLCAQWKICDMSRPKPTIVSIGEWGIPSDAGILFNGCGLSQWRNQKDGSEASWEVIDSCLVATEEWCDISTVRNFGDCQLHLEFMISTPVKGENNMRGNSGVVFMGKYEVQIMDSYRHETFADGQNAAIYSQYPPMVNASLPPDQWQSFDIIFTAPRFEPDGELLKPAIITMLHNGVLIHNNAELKGKSNWLGDIKYEKHPPKLPLVLQSHIQPIRFRNIWIRDMEPVIVNPYTHEAVNEITLPPDTMKNYAGEYSWAKSSQLITVDDKGQYLKVVFPDNIVKELSAYGLDRFMAHDIDYWFEFTRDKTGNINGFEMNNGGNKNVFSKRIN